MKSSSIQAMKEQLQLNSIKSMNSQQIGSQQIRENQLVAKIIASNFAGQEAFTTKCGVIVVENRYLLMTIAIKTTCTEKQIISNNDDSIHYQDQWLDVYMWEMTTQPSHNLVGQQLQHDSDLCFEQAIVHYIKISS